MILLRRFLVVQAFLLWQGGFLFYAAVVVPIGTEFLQSPTLQGMITQRVTHWLNAFGLVWAVIFGWDLFAGHATERRLHTLRCTLWFLCSVLLFGLIGLHRELDAMIDLDSERVLDKQRFRFWHEVYLWVTTIHWVFALVLAFSTLRAWRNADRSTPLQSSTLKDSP